MHANLIHPCLTKKALVPVPQCTLSLNTMSVCLWEALSAMQPIANQKSTIFTLHCSVPSSHLWQAKSIRSKVKKRNRSAMRKEYGDPHAAKLQSQCTERLKQSVEFASGECSCLSDMMRPCETAISHTSCVHCSLTCCIMHLMSDTNPMLTIHANSCSPLCRSRAGRPEGAHQQGAGGEPAEA